MDNLCLQALAQTDSRMFTYSVVLVLTLYRSRSRKRNTCH
jgi:hypothetical protein